jgi:hypothetical protein
MLINFTTKSIFVILILASFILISCYEEPIIEPVVRPYSSVRVGNFSYNQPGFTGNIDQFNVYVDGVLKGSVSINQFSGYFDLVSGNRRFVLTNGADTIYNNDINVASYAEISVVFDGVYAPGVDTLMSFAAYPIIDGVVYISEAPKPGKANVLVSNFAPNTDSKNQIKYSLAFMSTNFDTTIGRGLFEYNKTVGLELPQGDYTIHLLFDKTSDPSPVARSYDTLKIFNPLTITAGLKENIFITGIPDSTEELVQNSQTPLAVRPK